MMEPVDVVIALLHHLLAHRQFVHRIAHVGQRRRIDFSDVFYFHMFTSARSLQPPAKTIP